MSTTVASPTTGRVVTIEAKPGPLSIDTRETAVLVVDMQNDFGKIVYLKMAFRPDLSDAGSPGSPNRERHIMLGVVNRCRLPTAPMPGY